MEISQKGNSNATRFVLGDYKLGCAWKNSSGGRSLSLPCTEINHDRQALEERKQWLRSEGALSDQEMRA